MTKRQLVMELLNMGLKLGEIETNYARNRLIEVGESLVDQYVRENCL